MATIKSYSDLEQSKKLAEILPIESADMEYLLIKEKGLSCWSLAALLSVLPTLDGRNAEFCKDIRYDKWHIYYHGTATLPVIDTDRYESLVDACYEMIIKLNELNLL